MVPVFSPPQNCLTCMSSSPLFNQARNESLHTPVFSQLLRSHTSLEHVVLSFSLRVTAKFYRSTPSQAFTQTALCFHPSPFLDAIVFPLSWTSDLPNKHSSSRCKLSFISHGNTLDYHSPLSVPQIILTLKGKLSIFLLTPLRPCAAV